MYLVQYEFGMYSCFHSYFILAVIRVCIGVGVQFLCSYITLPLYALVTQMGSHMKKSIFDDQTSRALMNWHNKVKKKNERSQPRTRKLGGSPEDSPDKSPATKPANESSIETADQNTMFTKVDLPGESKVPENQSGNTDLLTGP
ncbi:hypothetical protein CDL12_15323 [Handroanthus impetiginosus]|uniref:MLO-like protein n=1 Tax=Handroanthus impetiginosus TaxID=429701 RepID=A0A2G9H3G9_9LAMI|nr:hypothetical protein CDL12_15323 [Handroanthus impetiginosus]